MPSGSALAGGSIGQPVLRQPPHRLPLTIQLQVAAGLEQGRVAKELNSLVKGRLTERDSPCPPSAKQSSISQTIQRFMAQGDLPRIRLHDLRHTHAAILLKENVHPKVVSERLGRSSIAFTMTVYEHVLPGMQAEAAATFGAAAFGK